MDQDALEIILSKDGYIYRIDTTAAFGGVAMMVSGDINRVIREAISWIKRWDEKVKLKYPNDHNLFIQELEKIGNLNLSKIERELKSFFKLYPEHIEDNYMEYLYCCRIAVKEFLTKEYEIKFPI